VSKGDVLLIHGAFAGAWTFERLRGALQRQDWRCHAPDLPFHGEAFAGREPHPELRRQGLAEYRQFLERAIARLPEKPVIIGHSLGGLLAQQLAARQLARAIVLLAPSPPSGVWQHSKTELQAAIGVLWHTGELWRKAVQPEWHAAALYSMDRMPPALQRQAFARLCPESGRALFETLHWWLDWHGASRVPAYRIDVPVLVVVGEEDKVNSPGTCQAIARRYGNRATYRTIPQMSHFIFGEPAEPQLTAVVTDWLEALAR
jgi:non-heme chloroperoxidase